MTALLALVILAAVLVGLAAASPPWLSLVCGIVIAVAGLMLASRLESR